MVYIDFAGKRAGATDHGKQYLPFYYIENPEKHKGKMAVSCRLMNKFSCVFTREAGIDSRGFNIGEKMQLLTGIMHKNPTAIFPGNRKKTIGRGKLRKPVGNYWKIRQKMI